MLNRTQIATMLTLQDQMNSKVDPSWIQTRNPFLRAAGVEAVEALEHIGWKWWKKQDKDLPQAQMELVDIWHFVLSDYILKYGSSDAAADAIAGETVKASFTFDGFEYVIEELDLLTKLELLGALSAVRRFEYSLFDSLLIDCEMGWGELYREYVGKNVLNMFRQDHGYKSGEYIKIWDGREDNEHLSDILIALSPDDSSPADTIYNQLTVRYPAI